MNTSVKLAFIFCLSIKSAFGHGYMYTPINRASRWRLQPTNWNISHNYEDNQYFCGGFAVSFANCTRFFVNQLFHKRCNILKTRVNVAHVGTIGVIQFREATKMEALMETVW